MESVEHMGDVGTQLDKNLVVVKEQTEQEIVGLGAEELRIRLGAASKAEADLQTTYGDKFLSEPLYVEAVQRRAVIEKALHQIEPWSGEVGLK